MIGVVSGLYDFPAREYGIQGRWPSPDPAGLAAVDPTNPQSWNRYAYVMNNPLMYVDPSGLCGEAPGEVSSTLNGGPTGPSDTYTSGPCSTFQMWLTMTNFACWWSGTCNGNGNGAPVNTGGGGGSRGGGGGGGQNSGKKKDVKSCLDAAHKGTPYLGKAVEFGSLLSITPGLNDHPISNFIKDWVFLPGVKIAGFYLFKTTSGIDTTSILTGVVSRIPTVGDATVAVTETVVKRGALPAVAFATGTDALVALDCAGKINLKNPPLLVPPLVSPILIGLNP